MVICAKNYTEGSEKNKGEAIWNDGAKYIGQWNNKNYKLEGNGKITFSDGSIYEGEWKNGQMSGQGKLNSKDGKVYEGSFVDGEKMGKGKLLMKNKKEHYIGDFLNGKFHGKGIYTYGLNF